MTDLARRARAPARTTASRLKHDDEYDDSDDADAARERFRQAVTNGDYAGLLATNVWNLFAEAAAQHGFATEIGALRYALVRLVAEETDPRHLATQLARVTTTILRAAEAQERAEAAPEDTIATALTRALTDLPDLPNTTAPLTSPMTSPRSRTASTVCSSWSPPPSSLMCSRDSEAREGCSPLTTTRTRFPSSRFARNRPRHHRPTPSPTVCVAC